MPITAGSISIARRINTGDCSYKEAKIELHYLAEGDEDIEILGAQAAHSAFVQLEQALAVKIDRPLEIHVDAPEPTAQPDASEPAAKRHRRTKAEMEAARATEGGVVDQPQFVGLELPVGVSPAAPALVAVQELKAALDPTLPTLLAVMEDPLTKTAMPVDGVTEGWDAEEITDKELNNTCNETMLRIKNKAKIQAVIREYTQDAVSTIPQSARAAFMQKLQAL